MNLRSVLLLFACAASPLWSQAGRAADAAINGTVAAYHAALKAGDAAAAMKLIADDAIFLESGAIETREQYEKNHLPEDIRFEKTVNSSWRTYRSTRNGDTAWVISTGELVGTFDEKPVNLVVVELTVLTRQSGQWKIRSVEWSSRRR